MKPEIKKRWVEALRSGKYEQGTNYLCREGKFCCLGVLCEIVKEEINLPVTVGADVHVLLFGADLVEGLLPIEVCEFVGLEGDDPEVERDGRSDELTSLNDNGHDFNAIADLIEAQL